jgi:hypothetical protein
MADGLGNRTVELVVGRVDDLDARSAALFVDIERKDNLCALGQSLERGGRQIDVARGEDMGRLDGLRMASAAVFRIKAASSRGRTRTPRVPGRSMPRRR